MTAQTVPYRPIAQFAEGWIRVAKEHDSDPIPAKPTQDSGLLPLYWWANEVMLRTAAYQTGAVENLYTATVGATQSVAVQDAGWETALAESGEGAPTAFEAQLAGYMRVLELATNGDIHPVTSFNLRTLHEIACASQTHYDTDKGPRVLHHGSYKEDENWVLDREGRQHLYCPHIDIQPELDAALKLYHHMLEDIGTHPAVLAAFLHWAIAHIHPFEDGNGRVARMFGSIPLIASYGVPIMVFADAKQTYFQALAAGDADRPEHIVDFTISKLAVTAEWRDQYLAQRITPGLDHYASELREIFDAQIQRRETTHIIINRVRSRIAEEIYANLEPYEERLGIHTQDFGLVEDDAYYGDVNALGVNVSEPFEITHRVMVATTLQVGPAGEVLHSQIVIDNRTSGEITLPLHDCTPRLTHEGEARVIQAADLAARAIVQTLLNTASTMARSEGTLPIKPPTYGVPPEDAPGTIF